MSIGINLISLGQHNVVESHKCDSGRVVGNPYLMRIMEGLLVIRSQRVLSGRLRSVSRDLLLMFSLQASMPPEQTEETEMIEAQNSPSRRLPVYSFRPAAIDRIASRSHTWRGSVLSLGCQAIRK